MRRIFLKEEMGDSVTVTGADARHLMFSLRAKTGQKMIIVDKLNRVYEGEITAFSPSSVTLKRLQNLPANPSLGLTLAVCLMKGGKMDFVVQKAVELGTSRIVPLVSTNSEIHLDSEKAALKRERWSRIAEEAAKQCGADAIPNIEPVQDIKKFLLAESQTESIHIFCYEGEKERSLKEVLRPSAGQNVTVVIGSEGGFTPKEADLAVNTGWQVVGLGSRILRAETAALALCAMVAYEMGGIG